MFNVDKLFTIMKEKGYNNQKMADALNNLGIKISADAFKQYKAGKSKPRMEVLEGIAEILGVFEQDFFDLSGQKGPVSWEWRSIAYKSQQRLSTRKPNQRLWYRI